ncbi:MAG: hypothetical protein FJZ11_04345 [Candidatus Omnitrophica bacterium]|nr:hypothetical protein [Candidatus Omnitrophota bacterium]
MIKNLFIIIGCILIFVSFIYAQTQTESFVYDSKGKRDPFLSLVSPEGFLLNLASSSETSELSVEGIIYDSRGKSYAIINSEVVKPGDIIGKFELISIEKNKVILIKDTERIEIELKEGN